MKIICTICSRRKKEDVGLLSAEERYTGEHISVVKKIAEESKVPFYILSGKCGLIPGSKKIPYYDYYLKNSAVDDLVKEVVNQIQNEKITGMEFYFENKETWAPYSDVIEKAAQQAGIALDIREI